VYITDTLSTGVIYGGLVSEMPSLLGPTRTGQLVSWYTPTLGAGMSGSIVFTVTVQANVTGTITNSVVITSSTPDPDASNNANDEPTEIITASLGGHVWDDADADGVQDPDENGIQGVTVKLYDDDSNLIATTTTDGFGSYEFTNLVPGQYYVKFVRPWGYAFSPQDQGADDKDSDAHPNTGRTSVIDLAAGATDLTWDAGIYPDSDNDRIPDFVEGTGDRDGDGIPDYLDCDPSGFIHDQATGQILAGGRIFVTGPGVVTIVRDGSDGCYEYWTDGTPGIYTITLTPPPGYVLSETCLPKDPPPFDPTGGPNPTVLGNGADGDTGYLTSNACPPYYFAFDLAPGDPFVINNNFPLHVYVPRPVGGVIVPVSKLELLAPWVGFATLMLVAVAAAVVRTCSA